MLNYIWGGMIILAFVFALFQDLRDEYTGRWNNDELTPIQTITPLAENVQQGNYRFRFEGISDTLSVSAIRKDGAIELAIPAESRLPDSWEEKRGYLAGEKADGRSYLRASIVNTGDQTTLSLPPVQWVKMNAITTAAIDMAGTAVSLSIGLIGVMAFWLGLMQIGYKSGLINGMNRIVAPIMRRLFPDVPDDHPAMSAISMNMAANVLGLGNAATPLGIKAMEELQKLNPEKEKATNAMCMFLAINTSSVQLLPPATLVALMGVGTNELMIPIILATLCSTIVAITAGKWFSRKNTAEVAA